jgi:hypothetical protein
MNKLLVYVVDIVFVNPIISSLIFFSPNNEFLISCLELAAACISACILACNAAYFVLLASTFALASSLPLNLKVLSLTASTSYVASIEDQFALASPELHFLMSQHKQQRVNCFVCFSVFSSLQDVNPTITAIPNTKLVLFIVLIC